MKFDNFLQKCYVLLEQELPDVPKPGDVKGGSTGIGKEIDDAGKKIEAQSEAVQEGVLDLIKGLVDVLMTEARAENIKLTLPILNALRDIKKSTLIPQPIEALSDIEDTITNLTSEYQK